ncbi:Gfo/Idh/MocA family protein [Ornithinimicrobium panacihumi]|uniref:Gfo/Idh/MocA family protein n=1 Tax=Ornithinimicrobium panacihumi TaxID=2008449 RepID=UPI003F8B8DB1
MSREKLRVGLVGVGKMGLSHLSMIRAHPEVEVVGVCDSSRLLLDVLSRYTGVTTYTRMGDLIERARPEALVIATPTSSHHPLVQEALASGLHTFCEKPLTLSPAESLELAALGEVRGLHTQVGYHNRFVASFQECQRLVATGAIGKVVHAHGQAEGPVVLRSPGASWRSRRDQGGSCLYDYAAHPIDLLNWCLGEPVAVSGTVVAPIFSPATDDAVYATIRYQDDVSAQLAVNWSDESQRKMSTQLSIWGTQGKITVDRQACQVYLRAGAKMPEGYRSGWNIRYTTELTPTGWFYLRGEEYSAQLDYFVTRSIARRDRVRTVDEPINSFRSAARTDEVMDMLLRDSTACAWTNPAGSGPVEELSPTARTRRPRRSSALALLTGARAVASLARMR